MLTVTLLAEQYQQLISADPRLRILEAARRLDVSELELLELCLGQDVVRLQADWKEFTAQLWKLEGGKASTRNDYVIQEWQTNYRKIFCAASPQSEGTCKEDADFHFSLKEWRYGYAVRTAVDERSLHSFQFFNKYGQSIHKVFLTSKSNPLAFHKLLEAYRANNQTNRIKPLLKRQIRSRTPKFSIERKRLFQWEWLQLQAPSEFSTLLKKYKLKRQQAVQMAPNGYAFKVNKVGIKLFLNSLAGTNSPIRIFVGNTGCLQTYQGTIDSTQEAEAWFTARDLDFKLHVNMHGVAESWVVKYPTVQGVVTSLEVFSLEGKMILQCLPSTPTEATISERWRKAIEVLPICS